jgi:hypothetical protein
MKNVLAFKIIPETAIPSSGTEQKDFFVAGKYQYCLLSRKSCDDAFMRFAAGKHLKKQSFPLITTGLNSRKCAASAC